MYSNIFQPINGWVDFAERKHETWDRKHEILLVGKYLMLQVVAASYAWNALGHLVIYHMQHETDTRIYYCKVRAAGMHELHANSHAIEIFGVRYLMFWGVTQWHEPTALILFE